jgi:hypothetical protein
LTPLKAAPPLSVIVSYSLIFRHFLVLIDCSTDQSVIILGLGSKLGARAPERQSDGGHKIRAA